MATFIDFFFRKRAKSAPPMETSFVFAGRPPAPPAPVSPNPAIRDMEKTLASLVHRVTETLAKTELYFAASDLRVLGMPEDKAPLCREANKRACALLLHPHVKRGERYVAFAGEITDALTTAERTAVLLRVLCSDAQNSPALPLVRRVAEACEAVISGSAKVLNAETADVFRLASVLVSARNDAETAIHKATTMLKRRPALVCESCEKLAKTIIWAMEVTAFTLADAALECRGVSLPAPPSRVAEASGVTVAFAPA